MSQVQSPRKRGKDPVKGEVVREALEALGKREPASKIVNWCREKKNVIVSRSYVEHVRGGGRMRRRVQHSTNGRHNGSPLDLVRSAKQLVGAIGRDAAKQLIDEL